MIALFKESETVAFKSALNKKQAIIPLIALLLIWLAYLLMTPSFLNTYLINVSFTEFVNTNSQPKILEFDVPYGRFFKIHDSTNNKNNMVITAKEIIHEDGTVVWNPGAGADVWSENSKYLKSGHYYATYTFYSQEEVNAPVNIQLKIR